MKIGYFFFSNFNPFPSLPCLAIGSNKWFRYSDEVLGNKTASLFLGFHCSRNIFWRCKMTRKYRDSAPLREVLSFELSSVPYALAHPDGSLRKTTKSGLLAELESVSPSVGRLPRSYKEAALILDEMALLQSWRTAGCTTFGELAQKLFEVITTTLRQDNCSRVNVVFDRYDNPYYTEGGERENEG